jgi:hypothetical protein
LPYAASSAKGIDQPSAGRPRQSRKRLSAVRLSRYVRSRITALRTATRLTLPRPPQPVPTFVTMANAPLLQDGMAGVLRVIWGNGEALYFFAPSWTGQISLKLLDKMARVRTVVWPLSRASEPR